MIQKKNRSWRMCVDCSKLNEAEWFFSLELDMAYHQIPLAEGDKGETAFATPRGGLLYLQWHTAVLYLDDIVVFGKTFE